MSTFYNKFKEEKEHEILKQKLLEQNFSNQQIIIQNRSTFRNFIRFLISAFLFVIKSLFYISITIFSSIGLTVILNESLRNGFIQFIKTVF